MVRVASFYRFSFLFLVVFSLMMPGFAGSPASARSGLYQQDDPPVEAILENGFTITFLGVVSNDQDDTSTWTYSVSELPDAQDLGYWVLELPNCVSVLDASPEPWDLVHPDPNTLLAGIKWEVGGGFEEGSFTITLDGQWEIGETQVAAKGPDVAYGTIAGPSCSQSQVPEELIPTVTWLAPVLDGEILMVGPDDIVQLEVQAADDEGVERVEFKRWDVALEDYDLIAIDDTPPYTAQVSASELHPEFNQINVVVYDVSGYASDYVHIWLYKETGYNLFLPLTSR